MAEARWSQSESETDSDSSCSDPGDDWDNDFAESSKKSQPSSMMGGWGGGATMESLLAAATGKGNPSVEKGKQTPSMGFSMGSGAKKESPFPGGTGGLDALLKGGMDFGNAFKQKPADTGGFASGSAAPTMKSSEKNLKAAGKGDAPKFGVATPLVGASAGKMKQEPDFGFALAGAGGFDGFDKMKNLEKEGTALRYLFCG